VSELRGFSRDGVGVLREELVDLGTGCNSVRLIGKERKRIDENGIAVLHSSSSEASSASVSLVD
jgi:hypothetical protein